jgi:hypothetical protein
MSGSGPANVVVITGLPRSGSTFLHRELARSAWTLPLHSALDPFAESGTAARARAGEYLRLLEARAPDVLWMHAMGVDLAEECIFLLASSFRSHRFEVTAFVPTYTAWRRESRAADVGILSQHLRLIDLMAHDAQRVVLKAPAYMEHLPVLTSILGERLKIVMLHRPFEDAMTSYVRLVAAVRTVFTREPPALDQVHLELRSYWQQAVDRYDSDAKGNGLAPTFHLEFGELAHHSGESLRQLRSWLGWK